VTGRGWTLATVSIATFMLLLDVTVVSVALPAVQHDLGGDLTALQWLIDAYALALAALLLTAGSIADRIGRRRMFVAGLALFTAASLACGLASTGTLLNLGRAVQGAGAAAMLATSLALIAEAYPPTRRHVALAVWGATSGAAIAVGPLVGGALIEGLGWRWIFFVNVPVGLGAMALAIRAIKESRTRRQGAVDWLGGVLLSGALAALVLALLRGNSDGWTSAPILALAAGCLVGLVAFLLVEARRAWPLLDLSVFRRPATAGVSLAVLAVAVSAFSMLGFLSLYLQNTLGHDALGTGLRLLPITVGAFFAGGIAGHAGAKVPARVLLGVGLALVGLGALLMSRAAPEEDWTALVPGFCVAGVGVGIVNPTVAGAAIAIAPTAMAGMASGLNNTFRLLGVAVGVAGLGAVFEDRVSERFAALVPGTPERLTDAVATGSTSLTIARTSAEARPRVGAAAERAVVAGLDEILLIAAVVAFAGAVAAALLVRPRDLVGGIEHPSPSVPVPGQLARSP